MIIIRQMDPSRATDKEGRWILRHVGFEEGELPDVDERVDVHAFLTSARAPTGTVARDLAPETVEFLGLEGDELKIPVALFQKIVEWPPS